jgi:hypothetical protein
MKNFKFGKNPKKEDPQKRTLQFSKYVKELAPPPASYSNLQRVYDNLGMADPMRLFPMDGNDQYGDCVVAGESHFVTIYNGMIGKKKIPTRAATLRIYNKLTGGQDTGLNMLDFLKYWKKHICGEKIIAFAEIDPRNHDNVKLAIRYFGGVYLGFNVQEHCINDFNNRIPWTPGRLLNEGHCIDAPEYNEHYVKNLTWGNDQLGTWAWVDQTWDECYAIIPVEAKDPLFAPGFNVDQLIADLAYVQK